MRLLKELNLGEFMHQLDELDEDSSGRKSDLVERLKQSLITNGHDPETFQFEDANDKLKLLTKIEMICQRMKEQMNKTMDLLTKEVEVGARTKAGEDCDGREIEASDIGALPSVADWEVEEGRVEGASQWSTAWAEESCREYLHLVAATATSTGKRTHAADGSIKRLELCNLSLEQEKCPKWPLSLWLPHLSATKRAGMMINNALCNIKAKTEDQRHGRQKDGITRSTNWRKAAAKSSENHAG